MSMKNWSENVVWNPELVRLPKTEQEVVDIILEAKKNNKTIRVIGSGHSFTKLCETNQITVSLDEMQGIIAHDKSNDHVTVHAGTKLYRLGDELASIGLSQENLGDINKQSIAGAVSTGTHGTGLGLGSIATQIVEISLIDGNGEKQVLNASNHPVLFRAAQLSLGTLGIVTEVKIRCKKSYNLALDMRKERLEDVLSNLEKINRDNRHFEYYLIPMTPWVQTRYSNIVEEDATYTSKFSAFMNDIVLENWALQLLCEVNRLFPKSAKSVAKTLSRFLSDERKVQKSHKVFSTVRNVKFMEMEYNVPYTHYKQVVNELTALIEKNNYQVAFPLEHRFVQQDDILLSPANGRDSAYIACHVYKGMPYERYFKDLEELFTAYDGRPHWGKMHTRTASYYRKTLKDFDTFLEIREKNDPQQIFVSPYIRRLFEL
jgi:FAD-linked oxidoreductase